MAHAEPTQNKTFQPGTYINLHMFEDEDLVSYTLIVIKELDFEEQKNIYTDSLVSYGDVLSYDPYNFMGYLVGNGFVVEPKYPTVHIGHFNDPRQRFVNN